MKYGKKNEVKINPLAYNLAIIGEAGIGKTTIVKQYCEKLAGEDGYMFLEIGKEDGADAITGINFLNCPEWDMEYDEPSNSIGFNTFVEDVVDNRTTDWKDLKVVVIDTYDELFAIAEPEVIDMHNRENPQKRVKSIKAAFGGFQAGEDKTVEIVLNALWSLKKVGVSFIIIGHTKNRNVTDTVTGEDYLQLTSNMPQKYFNAIKTKVHFLGVAAIDREIVKEKTGKKNVVTGQDIKKGVVKSETRRITFRDDNFVIDSKSRFADIVESIPFDVDAMIEAITDAIKKELDKSGVSYSDAKKKQDKEEKANIKRIAEAEKKKNDKKEIDAIVEKIVDFFNENKSNVDRIKPVLEKIREYGHKLPSDIDSIEEANDVYKVIEEV
jgi:GTPase SAR1 family protein